MKSTDDKGLIPVIVASEADTTYIRAIPTVQATAGDGSVSLDLGLPPECAIAVAAGGKRPEMKDMNGIWNLFSRAIQALQAGNIGQFDEAFASSIGGYPAGAIVSGSSVGTFWISTAENNTTAPGADGASWQSLFAGLSTETWTTDNFVAQQNDDNTYGAVSFGWNHVAGYLGVKDTSGAWRYIQPLGDYATNTALASALTAQANENATLEAGIATSVQQQVDVNTYGIKTFGYNHVAGTLGAFDTNGNAWSIQLEGDYATNTSLASESATRANEVADLQSGKANLAGGNAFTGVQTIEALNAGTTNVYGGELRTSFQDTNGFALITGYINSDGVRQFAFGNFDGTTYTTWFADNSTQRIIMPDGAVSAVTSELPTSGTITDGGFTQIGDVLTQYFNVSDITAADTQTITFPKPFSGTPYTCIVTWSDTNNASAYANIEQGGLSSTEVVIRARANTSGNTWVNSGGTAYITVSGPA